MIRTKGLYADECAEQPKAAYGRIGYSTDSATLPDVPVSHGRGNRLPISAA